MRTGGRQNAFPVALCGAGHGAPLPGHSGSSGPAPPSAAADEAGGRRRRRTRRPLTRPRRRARATGGECRIAPVAAAGRRPRRRQAGEGRSARGNGRRGAGDDARRKAAPRTGETAAERRWRRRRALGAGGGRMADGISGQKCNSVHLFLARISPPEFTPEFGGGGGRGEVWQGGVEQARSILKKTPAQNFPKKYFGNSARRGKRPGGKGNERHMRTHRPDNWIIPLGGEWRRTGALNSRHAPRRSGRIPGTARAKN